MSYRDFFFFKENTGNQGAIFQYFDFNLHKMIIMERILSAKKTKELIRYSHLGKIKKNSINVTQCGIGYIVKQVYSNKEIFSGGNLVD